MIMPDENSFFSPKVSLGNFLDFPWTNNTHIFKFDIFCFQYFQLKFHTSDHLAKMYYDSLTEQVWKISHFKVGVSLMWK